MLKSLLRDYIEALIVIVVFALLLRWTVISPYKITSTSMLPNLHVGDMVFAYKLPYALGNLHDRLKPTIARGDILAVEYPEDTSITFIKRVVAIEGDRVEWNNNTLKVNGEVAQYQDVNSSFQETHFFIENLLGSKRLIGKSQVAQKNGSQLSSVVVPPGNFLVLNDNRGFSDDSRYWGMVPYQYVEGRVFTVWLSLDWKDVFNKKSRIPEIRWDRMFKAVR